jgi:predicted HicB family RNase H-like nuclease
MNARNAAIVAYYRDGHKLKDCASEFQLGRQRVLQILQAAGAWRPYVKTSRDKFLGVNVTSETKDALKVKADEQGVSVSKFASNVLDEAVR